jgi:hypothetical protein
MLSSHRTGPSPAVEVCAFGGGGGAARMHTLALPLRPRASHASHAHACAGVTQHLHQHSHVLGLVSAQAVGHEDVVGDSLRHATHTAAPGGRFVSSAGHQHSPAARSATAAVCTTSQQRQRRLTLGRTPRWLPFSCWNSATAASQSFCVCGYVLYVCCVLGGGGEAWDFY